MVWRLGDAVEAGRAVSFESRWCWRLKQEAFMLAGNMLVELSMWACVCVCVCFPKDFKSHGPQWTKMHVTLVVVSYHLHMILHCERCSNSYTATAVAIDPRRRLLASLQLKCQKWYPWSWSTSFIQLLLDMWSFSTGDTSRWGRKGALCEFGLEPALKHHRSWMTLHASIC